MIFRESREEKLIRIVEELIDYLKKSEAERLELLRNIRSFYEFSVKKYKQEKKV